MYQNGINPTMQMPNPNAGMADIWGTIGNAFNSIAGQVGTKIDTTNKNVAAAIDTTQQIKQSITASLPYLKVAGVLVGALIASQLWLNVRDIVEGK